MPPSAPRAAKPTKEIFDPFNSSATGHQRAENRLSGSTLWRDSRHTKLRDQFSSGSGGGKRMLENGTVTWIHEKDQLSLQECLKVGESGGERKAKRLKRDTEPIERKDEIDVMTPKTNDTTASEDLSPSNFLSPIDPNTTSPPNSQEATIPEPLPQEALPPPPKPKPKQLFTNLTIYINGSTAPLISDHRLKHLLTTHGARISIALGRRTVTHVILSRPGSAGGGGGGLAGSKIQKEIANKRGESVKYVTAEWVLASVKAGRRLPETRFEALRLAPTGVGSVMEMLGGRRKGEKGAG